MNAAMYAARSLYHSVTPCISCVCGRVRLCCPRPVGSQVPSALQEGLASTATHPTRGCAFSGRIRRVDTTARRLSAKVADIRVQARATGLRYVSMAVTTEVRRRCLRPARIMRYSCGGTCLESACVFVAVQDAPGLRIRPRKSCDLMEVGRLARMRRFRATSSGHRLITDASLLCAQRIGLEPIVFRRQVRV